MDKPFAPACERNRAPILATLEEIIAPGKRHILEVGSGTGQHAEHFTAAHPEWTWQCTDQPEYLPGISQWQKEAERPNFPPPEAFDVRVTELAQPTGVRWDWVYTANTLHIMHWETVTLFFSRLRPLVAQGTGLLVYGPFNRGGQFTSESNASFDASLRQRDPGMGIRDLEAVEALADSAGLRLQQIHALPANNFLLDFRSVAGTSGAGS